MEGGWHTHPDARKPRKFSPRREGEGTTAVARLLTFVDIAEGDAGPEGHRMSVRARHEAVLADGGRVVLLDDRGWSGDTIRVGSDGKRSRVPGWAHETAEEIERTARVVVGPDEPSEGRTHAEMGASHWDYLARILQQQGVDVQGAELRALPHDVELSDRLLARLASPRRNIR